MAGMFIIKAPARPCEDLRGMDQNHAVAEPHSRRMGNICIFPTQLDPLVLK